MHTVCTYIEDNITQLQLVIKIQILVTKIKTVDSANVDSFGVSF